MKPPPGPEEEGEAAILDVQIARAIDELRYCRDLLREGLPPAFVMKLAAATAAALPRAVVPRPPPSVVRIRDGSVKGRALAALRQRARPLGLQDLIRDTGDEPSSIAVSLRRAIGDGLVVRTARGIYALAAANEGP